VEKAAGLSSVPRSAVFRIDCDSQIAAPNDLGAAAEFREERQRAFANGRGINMPTRTAQF
jgi:hypothetical protein